MKNKLGSKFILYIVLMLGALVFIFPYIYMIISSTQTNSMILGTKLNFKPSTHFGENLAYVQEKYNYLRVVWNSIFISVVGTFITTFITTLSGYVFAKYKFPYKKFLFTLVLISRMVPGFTLLIPTYYIFSKVGLTNSYTGIILTGLASSTSMFMMKQYAEKFPTELMESARIDGASEWYIFYKIALPVLKPSVVTVGLLNFMGCWNSYLFPLVMLNDSKKYTVPLIVQNMTQNTYDPLNYGALMALLSTSVIPIILGYMWVQTKFKSNDLDSAVK